MLRLLTARSSNSIRLRSHPIFVCLVVFPPSALMHHQLQLQQRQCTVRRILISRHVDGDVQRVGQLVGKGVATRLLGYVSRTRQKRLASPRRRAATPMLSSSFASTITMLASTFVMRAGRHVSMWRHGSFARWTAAERAPRCSDWPVCDTPSSTVRVLIGLLLICFSIFVSCSWLHCSFTCIFIWLISLLFFFCFSGLMMCKQSVFLVIFTHVVVMSACTCAC